MLGEPKDAAAELRPCELEAADARWFSVGSSRIPLSLPSPLLSSLQRAELGALDAKEHITAMHLWALDLAEDYAARGIPGGIRLHNSDALAAVGRAWNVYHVPRLQSPL